MDARVVRRHPPMVLPRLDDTRVDGGEVDLAEAREVGVRLLQHQQTAPRSSAIRRSGTTCTPSITWRRNRRITSSVPLARCREAEQPRALDGLASELRPQRVVGEHAPDRGREALRRRLVDCDRAVADDLGHGAAADRDDRHAAGHRLDGRQRSPSYSGREHEEVRRAVHGEDVAMLGRFLVRSCTTLVLDARVACDLVERKVVHVRPVEQELVREAVRVASPRRTPRSAPGCSGAARTCPRRARTGRRLRRSAACVSLSTRSSLIGANESSAPSGTIVMRSCRTP